VVGRAVSARAQQVWAGRASEPRALVAHLRSVWSEGASRRTPSRWAAADRRPLTTSKHLSQVGCPAHAAPWEAAGDSRGPGENP